jgi:hypothetical protein
MDIQSPGASQAINASALGNVLDRIHAHNNDLEGAVVGFGGIADRVFGPTPEIEKGQDSMTTIGSPAVIDQINAALSHGDRLVSLLRKVHRRLDSV